MKYIVTAEEMKYYDNNTIERIGIPASVLMERAALAALNLVEQCRKPEQGLCRVLVMAGMGNNGGDGLSLARLLSERGYDVEVWCVGQREKASGQWLQQEAVLAHYPVRQAEYGKQAGHEAQAEQAEPGKPAFTKEYDVLVDALFGIGLSRELSGEYARAVEQFNEMRGWKLSLDIPSGVDSDTGEIRGCAVRADATVTFGFCKRGLALYPGCLYAGRVSVAEIGISERAFFGKVPALFAYEEGEKGLLPERRPDGNKGTFGKVLLLAGGPGMAGAAVLAARAAYRAGAGMVKVLTGEENRVILQLAVPEALFGREEELEAALEWADVAAAGPGWGKSPRTAELLRRVLQESSLPLVLDGDALNLLSEQEELQELLREQTENGRAVVLTPHVGELSRLTGIAVQELKRNLQGYGTGLAARLHAVVAAKDARTFICREKGPCCVNLTGNSGMATAGSGDVLAGLTAGLLAQGMEPFAAASAGAWLHGQAGNRAAAKSGQYSCTAGEIVEEIKL